MFVIDVTKTDRKVVTTLRCYKNHVISKNLDSKLTKNNEKLLN